MLGCVCYQIPVFLSWFLAGVLFLSVFFFQPSVVVVEMVKRFVCALFTPHVLCRVSEAHVRNVNSLLLVACVFGL